MNYQKIYDMIIEKRKSDIPDGYVEKHHIIPRCLGGSDDSTNLVKLTAREHFICHMLLMKIYEDDAIIYPKMTKAVICMFRSSSSQERYSPSKWYESLKIKFSEVQSKCQSGKGNSQYATSWIHDPLTGREGKLKLGNNIPVGFVLGRFKKPRDKNTKKQNKELRRETDIKVYTEYYEIYKESGWNKFVDITSYDKTQENLVQRFRKLLGDNFKSQNGKKR